MVVGAKTEQPGSGMTTSTAQFDPALNREWAERFHMLDRQPLNMAEAAIAAREAQRDALARLDALAKAHPDERLSFLMSEECGFNTDHIRQTSRVVDEFLDICAKRQIRQLAGQALDDGASSQSVVDRWFTEERLRRLYQLVDTLDVPDKFIVACHVWLKIRDAARASYLRHLHRRQPRPDFARFERTIEERAEDLRWAKAE